MTPPENAPDLAELHSLVQQLVQGIRQSVDAVPHADMREDLQQIAATLEEANANLLAEHEAAEAELAAIQRQAATRPPMPEPASPEDVLALGYTLRKQLLARYVKEAPAAGPPPAPHGNVWSQLEGVTTVPPPPPTRASPTPSPSPLPPSAPAAPDRPGSMWREFDDLEDPPHHPDPKGKPPDGWEKRSQIEGL